MTLLCVAASASLHIEFELKYGVVTGDLKRKYGQDMDLIVCFYKL